MSATVGSAGVDLECEFFELNKGQNPDRALFHGLLGEEKYQLIPVLLPVLQQGIYLLLLAIYLLNMISLDKAHRTRTTIELL